MMPVRQGGLRSVPVRERNELPETLMCAELVERSGVQRPKSQVVNFPGQDPNPVSTNSPHSSPSVSFTVINSSESLITLPPYKKIPAVSFQLP